MHADEATVGDDSLANVAIDCQVVPRQDLGTGAASPVDNWEIDRTTSPPMLRFLNGACSRVQDGISRVDVIYDCPLLQ